MISACCCPSLLAGQPLIEQLRSGTTGPSVCGGCQPVALPSSHSWQGYHVPSLPKHADAVDHLAGCSTTLRLLQQPEPQCAAGTLVQMTIISRGALPRPEVEQTRPLCRGPIASSCLPEKGTIVTGPAWLGRL